MNKYIIQKIPTIYNRILEKIEFSRLALSGRYDTPLFYIPNNNKGLAKNPVVIMHGIQSHPGWFLQSGEFLATRGYPVFWLTRRGSGFNTAHRGHAKSPRQLFDDLDRSLQAVMEITGASKVHLVGISWGGKLLPAYCIRRLKSDFVSTLSIISPGIFPKIDISLRQKLSVAAGVLFNPRKKFDIPLNAPELFTDNPVALKFLADDPQRLHQATARFMYTSRLLDKIIAHAKPGQLKIPCNLILASRDRIIDNKPTIDEINRLTAGGAKVVTLQGSHTLEFEPDPSKYHQALLDALGD